jgi:hypothetical protein
MDTQNNIPNNAINDMPSSSNPTVPPTPQKQHNKTYTILVFLLAVGLVGALFALKSITKKPQIYSAQANKTVLVPTAIPLATPVISKSPDASISALPIRDAKDLDSALEKINNMNPDDLNSGVTENTNEINQLLEGK